MTNAMASKEVISLLQDMATQYESHFQTRQGEHLDAFDQKVRIVSPSPLTKGLP